MSNTPAPATEEPAQPARNPGSSGTNGAKIDDAVLTTAVKADQLNEYYYLAGQPDYFQKDLDRYRAVTADDVKRVVRKYLQAPRVTLSIVPLGKKEMAVTKKETVQ